MTTATAARSTSTARPVLLGILCDAIERERAWDAGGDYFEAGALWRSLTSAQRRAMDRIIVGFLAPDHRAFSAESWPSMRFASYVVGAALGWGLNRPEYSRPAGAVVPPARVTYRLTPAPRLATHQARLFAWPITARTRGATHRWAAHRLFDPRSCQESPTWPQRF